MSMMSLVLSTMNSCQSPETSKEKNTASKAKFKLATLDPGHFHAALVQKTMYPGIDTVVAVYGPDGPELKAHLTLIEQYNNRKENPTHWIERLYTGPDFLQKMKENNSENVVVIAGNNGRKADYIQQSIAAGVNVLADKPMIIQAKDFDLLNKNFELARQQKVLLYDIMTERSEITNLLQRELSQSPEVFGSLQKGSPKDPAVVIESVHYFYKNVSGKTLTRPWWFFDPLQQGEAIADVATHLIDLVQWECYPDIAIDYKKDINISSAKTWPSLVTRSQFSAITKTDSFPAALKAYVKSDSILQVKGNGEINYSLKDTHIKLTARWDYEAAPGSGDTHYSLIKGTVANLEIKQGKDEGFQPTLYVNPVKNDSTYSIALEKVIAALQNKYPGIGKEKTRKGWKLSIPAAFKVGHEAHFGQVMKRFLQYLETKQLPAWEEPCMLSKYYTSTKALEMAQSQKEIY